jgi:hypothetical protein
VLVGDKYLIKNKNKTYGDKNKIFKQNIPNKKFDKNQPHQHLINLSP